MGKHILFRLRLQMLAVIFFTTIFTGGNSTRQTAHERISAVTGITGEAITMFTAVLKRPPTAPLGYTTGGILILCHTQEGGNLRCDPHGLGSLSRGNSCEWCLGAAAEGHSHKPAGTPGSISGPVAHLSINKRSPEQTTALGGVGFHPLNMLTDSLIMWSCTQCCHLQPGIQNLEIQVPNTLLR